MDYVQTAQIAYNQTSYLFWKSMFQPNDYSSLPSFVKDTITETLHLFATQTDSLNQPEFYEAFDVELSEGCYFVEYFGEDYEESERKDMAADELFSFLSVLYPGCAENYGMPSSVTVEHESAYQQTFNILYETLRPMVEEIVSQLYHDEMEQRRLFMQQEAEDELAEDRSLPFSKVTDKALTTLRVMKGEGIANIPSDLNFPPHYEQLTHTNICYQESYMVDDQEIFFQIIHANKLELPSRFYVTVVTKPIDEEEYRILYVSDIKNFPSQEYAKDYLKTITHSFSGLLKSGAKGNKIYFSGVLAASPPSSPLLDENL